MTLDLRSEAGREVLARLIAEADVLVENYRPGVLAEMGFPPKRLEALNPDLVVASVNGYGSTGPYAMRPAFDFIAQAMTGFMAVNGTAETGPMRCGPPITDLLAGLYTALGVVSALRVRDREGGGQSVEASMLNAMISMMAYLSAAQFADGAPPEPTGNDHPIASPYGLFTAADGYVAVAPSTEKVLRRFLGELGLEALLDSPAFDTNQKRVARRPELNARIDAAMRGDTQEAWIERLNRAGVPCGRVQSLSEVFEDPQVQHQEMVIDVPHPGHGTVRMTGFPLKFSQTPCRINRPAPDLGADTDAVLAEAGYDAAAIAALRAEGVVG